MRKQPGLREGLKLAVIQDKHYVSSENTQNDYWVLTKSSFQFKLQQTHMWGLSDVTVHSRLCTSTRTRTMLCFTNHVIKVESLSISDKKVADVSHSLVADHFSNSCKVSAILPHTCTVSAHRLYLKRVYNYLYQSYGASLTIRDQGLALHSALWPFKIIQDQWFSGNLKECTPLPTSD